MSEINYSRARRVALFGLALQLVVFATLLTLGVVSHSTATSYLAYFVVGGVPIWFVTLLVFRQQELAAQEAFDLEQLRRERAAAGAGAALFEEGGGAALGMQVAATRLKWMQRWLTPLFGLITGLYLVGLGAILFWGVYKRDVEFGPWPQLSNIPGVLIGLAVALLLLFLLARFASGLGRVSEWQLLRACGSYMLANAAVTLAIMIALGVQLYAGVVTWERYLALIVPVLMAVLGAETLLNFLLDVYRPRTPGVEPRAAFDSRIVGLFAEPGGLAHSLAEAINYQFGFEVSQTWFYQFLQRAAIPLVLFGVVVLWLITSLVIVQPFELAVVERFGRPLNADAPLPPGLHLKWPWPIEVAHKYNTRQLHQIVIGTRVDQADGVVEDAHKEEEDRPKVVQWVDQKHGGAEEFNFLVVPARAERAPGSQPSDGSQPPAPVHILRMTVAIQYQILPEALGDYVWNVSEPHALLRDLAWQELLRFNASCDTSALLGELRTTAGEILRGRIQQQVERYKLGLHVVYVGFQDVHPERSVAQAFRDVIGAEQDRITTVRQAQVMENDILSRVAGSREKALVLSAAISQHTAAEAALTEAERRLRELGAAAPAGIEERLAALRGQFMTRLEAGWAVDRARQVLERLREEQELKLGSNPRQRQQAEQALAEVERQQEQAEAAFVAALAPLRSEARQVKPEVMDALIAQARARFALEFWSGRLVEELRGLEGEAAVVLANAQASRWETEARAASELVLLERERTAYAAAPEIYKARSYLQALVNGIRASRKYLLMFENPGKQTRVRIEAQETARPDTIPTRPMDSP